MFRIGLFYVFPALDFPFFALNYKIVHDGALPAFLAAFLAFSFAPFHVLQKYTIRCRAAGRGGEHHFSTG